MNKKASFIFWTIIILIVLAIFLIILSSQNKNYSKPSPQVNNVAEKENSEQTKADYGSLQKEEVNFEGYHYCIFVFDPKYENYTKTQNLIYNEFCNVSERFPQIQEFLYNEYKVDIEKEEWQTAALYTGNGIIILNDQFKSAKNLDLYLAHEIAHSSTESLNIPAWFSEGIAEYSGYRFYGTQYKLNPFWFDTFASWDPSYDTYAINIKGYAHAGFVVRHMIETYGVDSFKKILINLDGKIGYSDNTDTKNQKIVEAVREVTGNQTITLMDIINPTGAFSR